MKWSLKPKVLDLGEREHGRIWDITARIGIDLGGTWKIKQLVV